MKAVPAASPIAPLELRTLLPARLLLDPIPLDDSGRYSRKQCLVPECSRISTRKDHDLCRTHGELFSKSSITSAETWAPTATLSRPHTDAVSNTGHFVVDTGSRTLRDQLAYGLFRRGERNHATAPEVLNSLARQLAQRRIDSLLEIRYKPILIEEIVRSCGGYASRAKSFLLDALDETCLAHGVEPTRRYLGIAAAGGGAFVNLNGVENPSFRATIERWMNYRLNAEVASPQYTQAIVGWASAFTTWLTEEGIDTWSEVTRPVLLRYLDVVKALKKADGRPYSNKYRAQILNGIAVFLNEARANEWAEIPPSAQWLKGEKPRPGRSKPRLIGKTTAARLRDPNNLKLVADHDCRLAIRIMAETGLRRKDVCAGITTDGLLDLGDGKWSLIYWNSKAPGEETIPISGELASAITEHVDRKRLLYPGARMLFARDNNDTVITLTIVNKALHDLIEQLDLRDASGNTVKVTPHMFRHQNATDWLENGVPLPVIQKLLGHRSIATTEIYARMSEQKVREEWEQSRAVNHEGNPIYQPGSVEMDAAWVHAFMGGATQALPNGRCGMPCNEECEHANACLYCPLFITTPDYLPVLREQREEHETMMRMAEEAGHQRIVERNRKPFIALTKLIENLERISVQEGEA